MAGFEGMDETLPLGSEKGFTWDDYMREIRSRSKGFAALEHELSGAHKAGFLVASMIADGIITEAKLAAAVQAKLNQVGIGLHLSQETDFTEQTIVTTEKILGQLTLAANTFTKVLVTGEAWLNNASGSAEDWTLRIYSGGSIVKPFDTMRVRPENQQLAPVSTIIAGGQGAATAISVRCYGSRGSASANVTAKLKNMRLWGIS